jgi:hypothetical protein
MTHLDGEWWMLTQTWGGGGADATSVEYLGLNSTPARAIERVNRIAGVQEVILHRGV